MNMLVCVSLLVIGVIIALPSSAQNRQLKIRVGTPNPPRSTQQTGDRFQINTEGDIEIEHKNQTGKIEQLRIPRRNKVRPEVVAATESTGSQTIRYSYTISNGMGARQSIDHLAVGASRPDLIKQAFGPAKWSRIASPPDIARYNWFSREESADIAPGGGTVQVGFEAPLLPGFMTGYFKGRLSGSEVIVELDNGSLSPWLTEKVSYATMYHNDTFQMPVIGPKFEMRTSGELAQAVAAELLAAAAMPEFANHKTFLENTGTYLKDAGRSAAGLSKTLSTMGHSPMQTSFFRAMALNFEYLEKLP